jgi:hypothetical protein
MYNLGFWSGAIRVSTLSKNATKIFVLLYELRGYY